MGVLAHYGCRRIIIQVDAAHWCWLRRFPHFYVKCFEYPEKRYINVTNYSYNKYLPFFFPPFFVNLKGFIIGKLVWLYCSDNLQNSKTNKTMNRDKIVNRDISKKKSWYYIFSISPTPRLNHNLTKQREYFVCTKKNNNNNFFNNSSSRVTAFRHFGEYHVHDTCVCFPQNVINVQMVTLGEELLIKICYFCFLCA